MTKPRPYAVVRIRDGYYSSFTAACRVKGCGWRSPFWDYQYNCRWKARSHVEQEHPELVAWTPAKYFPGAPE